MQRYEIMLRVSTFAHDQADAEYLAKLMRERLDFGGQTTVHVESVRAEQNHEFCTRLGVCLCK